MNILVYLLTGALLACGTTRAHACMDRSLFHYSFLEVPPINPPKESVVLKLMVRTQKMRHLYKRRWPINPIVSMDISEVLHGSYADKKINVLIDRGTDCSIIWENPYFEQTRYPKMTTTYVVGYIEQIDSVGSLLFPLEYRSSKLRAPDEKSATEYLRD